MPSQRQRAVDTPMPCAKPSQPDGAPALVRAPEADFAGLKRVKRTSRAVLVFTGGATRGRRVVFGGSSCRYGVFGGRVLGLGASPEAAGPLTASAFNDKTSDDASDQTSDDTADVTPDETAGEGAPHSRYAYCRRVRGPRSTPAADLGR